MLLKKTLECPLDCKEIQPVHPKEISPEYSLEGLMLKLKLQYFGHLMRRTDSFEKTMMLGKIGGRGEGDSRGWGRRLMTKEMSRFAAKPKGMAASREADSAGAVSTACSERERLRTSATSA